MSHVIDMAEDCEALRGDLEITASEIVSLLLSLIQIGDLTDATLLLTFIHSLMEGEGSDNVTLFPGAGEPNNVTLTFSEDLEISMKEREFLYAQLDLISANLRFITWEKSEDKITLDGLAGDSNMEVGESSSPQSRDSQSDSQSEMGFAWMLFEDSPQLLRIGSPGEVRFIPRNYCMDLIDMLQGITVYGSSDDMEGAGYMSSDLSEQLMLSTHSIDMVADSALLLWKCVCLPLLNQLDSLDAVNLLNPHSGSVFSPNTTSPIVRDQEEMADPLDVGLLVSSLRAVRSGLITGKVDDPVLSATVNLRLVAVLGEVSMGDDLRRALQVCRVSLTEIEQARSELVSVALHMPSHRLDLSALSTASLTCQVSDETARDADQRPSAYNATSSNSEVTGGRLRDPGTNQKSASGVFGAGSALDPLVQTLAALHVDLLIMCFRLEFLLAEAQAKHAICKEHTKAPSTAPHFAPKASKKGVVKHSDAARHSATPQSTSHATLVAGLMAGSQAMEVLPDPLFIEPFVPSTVEAANQRSSVEARKNLVSKALLLIETASSLARTSKPIQAQDSEHIMFLGGDRGACAPPVEEPPNAFSPLGIAVSGLLKDAYECLDLAEQRELELSHDMVVWEDWAGNFTTSSIVMTREMREEFRLASPPPPAIVSRSDGTITVQPRRWFPLNNVDKVAYYRVFGKTAGSGTMVSLQNGDLGGTNQNVIYDDQSGTSQYASIRYYKHYYPPSFNMYCFSKYSN